MFKIWVSVGVMMLCFATSLGEDWDIPAPLSTLSGTPPELMPALTPTPSPSAAPMCVMCLCLTRLEGQASTGAWEYAAQNCGSCETVTVTCTSTHPTTTGCKRCDDGDCEGSTLPEGCSLE